jgi:MFS family permease
MGERLLALAVLAGCGVYLANAWWLAPGTAARPGAGFFPLAVGVFGLAVGLAWVVSALQQAPAAGPVADAGGRRRAGITAALLAGFCLLLPWTGYPVAALLFTGLLLRGLGAGWMAALAVALPSALASYYVFAVLLGVPLPRGLLLD